MWTQAKIYLAAAILIVWSAGALFLGREWGRADGADRAAKLLSDQMDAVLAAQAEDAKRTKKLQDTLDKLPKSEGKVRDAVRNSPSKCERPAAVADSVQDAIRKANAARALPRNP